MGSILAAPAPPVTGAYGGDPGAVSPARGARAEAAGFRRSAGGAGRALLTTTIHQVRM
ncbi:hypothetical protein GCM10017562_30690 [Streptomyces roseofulvus]